MPPLIRRETSRGRGPILALALVLGTSEQAAEPEGEPAPREPAPATLTEALPADAGVVVQTLCTNCNNADLSIAGLSNDHVSVVCDGFPVFSGLGQVYLLSVMPQTMIDKVAVVKGAGNVQFEGGAVGGGIKLERREPQPGFLLNTSADAGGFGWRGSRLDLSGRKGNVGGYFVGSWSQSDEIVEGQANGTPAVQTAWLPDFVRHTLEAGLTLKPGGVQRLRFGAARYHEDQRDGPAGFYSILTFPSFELNEGYNQENVRLQRTQYDASYELPLWDGSVLDVRGAWTKRDQDVDETETRDGLCRNLFSGEFERFCPAYLIDERGQHGSFSWRRSIGQQAQVRAGLSVSDRRFDVVDVAFNRIRAENPNLTYPKDFALEERLEETGLWAEGDMALGSRLNLTAGLRYVRFAYTDNEAELNAVTQGQREAWLAFDLPEGSRLVPRAVLRWKPRDPVELRFSAGAGYRAPNPSFDHVCCGRKYQGNRGLPIEESRSFGLEVVHQPRPGLRVGGSVFVTDFDHLIVNMATTNENHQLVYQNASALEARNTSLSVEGSLQAPGWLTSKISYTWLDAENRTADDAIVAVTDADFSTPHVKVFHYHRLPNTVRSRGALALDFRASPSVHVGVAGQYTGTTWVQEFLAADIREDLVEREDFWVVNLKLDKAFRNGIALYAGMDNAFNYTQADLGDPSFDYKWGPLRGRYVYGGLSYRYGRSSP